MTENQNLLLYNQPDNRLEPTWKRMYRCARNWRASTTIRMSKRWSFTIKWNNGYWFIGIPSKTSCLFRYRRYRRYPVSIAVASTLDGPKYFEKADDTLEAGYQMVKQFMDYLMNLQEKLVNNLEPEIEKAISFLQTEKEELFNPQRYQSKAELNKLYGYFKNYEVLKVFGFNSRYVTYCTILPFKYFFIFVRFVQFWTIVHFKHFSEQLFILSILQLFSANLMFPFFYRRLYGIAKKMNLQWFHFKNTEKFHIWHEDSLVQFRDVLSYTSPCNLDRFLRQWKTTQTKGFFPHG